MEKKESKSSWYKKCVLVFIITFGVFFVKYPQYVLHPNEQTYYSGGDPLVTLYDMIYHVRYDTSGTFSGMNYPEGDFLFMTDANGSFSTVFRWVNTYLFNIDGNLSGIMMSIIYLLLGFCGMFLFMILRTSGVSCKLSIILAPLITFLSPQIARIACHLSLAFPFVIPMIMLWTLRKYKVPRFEVWDLIFAFTTFFFFMNNAYIGFIMCMFAGLIGFILLLKGRKTENHRTASLIIMGVPVAITILIYFILKINDPYDDRLEKQWGFFYYHTQISSFFYSKYSLAASFMKEFQVRDPRSIEWTNNLGLIPIGLIVSYFIYSIRRIFNKSLLPLIKIDTMMSVFLWASFLMYIFAANTSLLPIQEIVEPFMGPLLMFKSSGRFSWPLYFVVALLAAKILQAWVDRLNLKGKNYALFLLIPALLFYGYETNFYLNKRFSKLNKVNYLAESQTKGIRDVLAKSNIDLDHYQGMYILPLLVGWNEKIIADVSNLSERGALTVSSLTGIPMINARLSRNSTSKTLLATQMSSHPILHKDLMDRMLNDKPILLIEGTETKGLSYGEKALKSLGQKVFEVKNFRGYKVQISDILASYNKRTTDATEYYNTHKDSSSTMITRMHFDDTETENSLFGKGAFLMPKGTKQIAFLDFESDKDEKLKFTAWTEITNEKYGMPELMVVVKGPGKHYSHKVVIARKFKDIYKNWIRSEYIFNVPKGKCKLEIISKVNQEMWMDELNISYARDTTLFDLGNGNFLFNNYPVIRE